MRGSWHRLLTKDYLWGVSIKNCQSMQCEPQGNRFVILDHFFPAEHGRTRHFDLMLEFEGILETFECPLRFLNAAIPANGQHVVVRLPDHRPEYLEYEGEISGNRGEVKRITRGEVIWEQKQERSFRVQLIGVNWQRWVYGQMVAPTSDGHWILEVDESRICHSLPILCGQ